MLTRAEWRKGGFVAYHLRTFVPSLRDEFACLFETVLPFGLVSIDHPLVVGHLRCEMTYLGATIVVSGGM